MPSCYAQDVAPIAAMGSSPLVASSVDASAEVAGAPVTRREPAGECDPNWCRIADHDHGKRCGPHECLHFGTPRPKAKCKHELWGRPPLPGARPATAAEKKSAALWKARASTARDVHASLERLAKALKKAKAAKVLAPGEDDLLRTVEGWKKAIAAERKPRRK